MMRAVIIDDEQSCIERLSVLLAGNHADTVELIASCRTVKEGLDVLTKLNPDVVFLDVQIQEQTGFDLLQQVPEIRFEVVFVTAFEKYAVQAFKVSAIDYLLKPVDPEDLRQAIGKLHQKLSRQEMSRKLDVLFHNLKTIEGASKKISVPTINGLEFLQVSDIIRCEADANYTHIVLKNKQKITVAKTLKEFEELLTEYNFFRIHNSHLINLAHVVRYEKGKGGFVSMDDNSQIEVSTRRKEEFLQRFSQF